MNLKAGGLGTLGHEQLEWLEDDVKHQPGAVLPGYRLLIEALAVVIVTLTGHLGGFLSG